MGTLTSSVRLSKPTIGGDASPIWPNELNSDMDYIDEAINQQISIPVADVNVILVADGGSSDQARYLTYVFTGALTADRTATLPANPKTGWVVNLTTGTHNIILTTGSGTAATVPSGGAQYLFFCDGANVSLPAVGFGGAMTIEGAASVSGNMSVGGATAIAGNMTVSGAFIAFPSGVLTIGGLTTSAPTNGGTYGSNGIPGTFSGLPVNYGLTTASNVLSSGFIAFSDKRVKTNIEEVSEDDGIEWIRKALPVSYLKDGIPELGFLAQDQVIAGYGKTVIYQEDSLIEEMTEGGIVFPSGQKLMLRYDNFHAYETAAIKYLIRKIEALTHRVDELEMLR